VRRARSRVRRRSGDGRRGGTAQYPVLVRFASLIVVVVRLALGGDRGFPRHRELRRARWRGRKKCKVRKVRSGVRRRRMGEGEGEKNTALFNIAYVFFCDTDKYIF